MKRLRALPPRTFDRVLAAAAAVPCALEAALTTDSGSTFVAIALIVGMAATLAVRRQAPLPGLVVFFVLGVPLTLGIDESESFFMPFLMVLVWAYSAGAQSDGRTAIAGLGLVLAGIAAISLSFGDPVAGDFIFPMGFASAAWLAARTIRHRAQLSAELHEAAVRAEEDREAQALRAVADERRPGQP